MLGAQCQPLAFADWHHDDLLAACNATDISRLRGPVTGAIMKELTIEAGGTAITLP